MTTKELDLRLRELDLFKGLLDDKLSDLARGCRWRTYPTGRQIIGYQDSSQDVFFIVTGKVRVTIFSLAGKEVSYRDIEAGNTFGELAAIDGQMRSADVIALEDSLLGSMPAERFWETVNTHPEVAGALLRHLTGLIRLYSERIFEFSTIGVRNRIHAELLRLARAATDENLALISPAPTHAEIASRISTHREAVTRELNNLIRIGLLERASAGIQVLDVARLEQMVDEVLG